MPALAAARFVADASVTIALMPRGLDAYGITGLPPDVNGWPGAISTDAW
jgi:hypothetical protein